VEDLIYILLIVVAAGVAALVAVTAFAVAATVAAVCVWGGDACVCDDDVAWDCASWWVGGVVGSG
jgi:hypothetical protein